MAYRIINHRVIDIRTFRPTEVIWTKFDTSVIGMGYTELSAYQDALEQIMDVYETLPSDLPLTYGDDSIEVNDDDMDSGNIFCVIEILFNA